MNVLRFINMLISIVIMIVTIMIIQMKSFLDDTEHQTSTWSPGYQGSPGSQGSHYQYVDIEHIGINKFEHICCHNDIYHYNYPNEVFSWWYWTSDKYLISRIIQSTINMYLLNTMEFINMLIFMHYDCYHYNYPNE